MGSGVWVLEEQIGTLLNRDERGGAVVARSRKVERKRCRALRVYAQQPPYF